MSTKKDGDSIKSIAGDDILIDDKNNDGDLMNSDGINRNVSFSLLRGGVLDENNLSSGTQDTIFRIVEAYNFPNRQALSNYLNIPNSTLSYRFNNNLFPSDWVIKCVLETGVSLLWLVSGEGAKFIGQQPDTLQVSSKKIQEGKLLNYATFNLDKAMISEELHQPIVICIDGDFFIVDYVFNSIVDGLWLINIDGVFSIRSILRLPGGKVQVSINSEQKFECSSDDIEFVAKVITEIKNI